MEYQRSVVINCLTSNIIPMIVEEVRCILSDRYDVTSEDYIRFAGLCHEASEMVIHKLKDYLINKGFTDQFTITSMHGEQRHTPMLKSKYWPLEHTWVCLNILDTKIYIDPTSSQFSDIYDDIPPYYISTKQPKWFYHDRKNPSWNGITGKINQWRFIPRRVKCGDEVFIAHDGLIDFLQYDVWGRISDIIRKFK